MIRNAAAIIHLNCGTAVEAVLLEKLPVQLEYLNTPATAGHARLPARVSRATTSFDELLAVVDHLDEETDKFDFAGVHAANIEAFFYRNDGAAADRVADIVLRANDPRQPFVSLASALRGSRPNPSLGQLAKGAASLVFGSAATEKFRTWFSPARRDKRIKPADVEALLKRIAVHDQRDPSLFAARRARCVTTGLPLASIVVEQRPGRS
jgi:hypothetical protein